MKRGLLFFVTVIALSARIYGQGACTATSFQVDLSSSIDTTVTFQSTRNGDCCNGTNCIRFDLTLNPACSYVNFTVINPAPPGNAAYYQIDCGPQTSLGTPICVVGKTNVTITFCKPGNDNPIYTIVAAGALKGSDDITVREGCTGTMSVSGLVPATINWTSIYPGAQGAYDANLSCTSGCITTNVLPKTGSPAYIDYQVSGNRLCGPVVSDTIRVYVQPQIAVAITPDNPSVCAGGSTSVTLTAMASGGNAPYAFTWNTGQTGPSITVNSGGSYQVSVTDSYNCLPAVQTTIVATTPLPAAPVVGSNSPVCAGGTINLSAAAIAGASYSWTGPNGFTSSLQNPVISNATLADAGSYSVTVKVGQCTSNSTTTSVVINTIPSSPSISTDAPVCEGSVLNLTASAIAGASYTWTGPNGFTTSAQNPAISNVQLVNAGNYAVTATVNGCTSSPASATAVVHPLPSAPVVSSNAPLCEGSNLALSAGTISNASYLWFGPNGFTAAIQNPVIPNSGLSASGSYSVKAIVNGCTGPAGTIVVTVYPIPSAPTVSSNGPVCEGASISLSASSMANASYSWMGPNGFSSSVQQPSIVNATTAASGIYSVTATVNGCSSPSATGTVTVHTIPSTPVITGNSALCEGTTLSLAASTITGAAYAWTGPNGFSSALQNPVISNVTTSHSGNYFVTATVNGCTSAAAGSNVTVTGLPVAPSVSSNSPVCTGSVLSLNAASLSGAIYSWTGPNGFSSALQNPVLPAASMSDNGTYQLTVRLNGCTSAGASSATVVVNQTPSPPMVTNDGPVCAGGNLHLSAFSFPGASYSWTGPAGFSSSAQNNTLSAVSSAYAGNYYATVTVNGCTSARVFTPVNIDQPAFAYAGKDQVICSAASSVSLNGTISGGNNAGLWTTNGSGTFSPSNANLTANYFPSAADRSMGSVTLDLTSVQNGTCPASSSSMLIKFVLPPSADAGGDQVVCANKATVVLDGKTGNAMGARWTSSGSGFFSPSDTILETTYIPGAGDKSRGSVILNLATTGSGPCPAATDQLLVSIKTPPLIHTGGIQYVLENNSLVLAPAVSGSNLKFSWTPAIYLNNDAVINPVCSPKSDVSYTLVARDQFDCAASADVSVKLLKQPEIPNVFTPNGDGVNDRWQIRYLKDYPDCQVEIFNRYGQSVYKSTGYTNEWNGTSNGRPLPAGTYYYIINQKTGLKPLSGFVDIVR